MTERNVSSSNAQQSLRLSPELWRRARQKAVGEGRSMTAVVENLLADWVDDGPDRAWPIVAVRDPVVKELRREDEEPIP